MDSAAFTNAAIDGRFGDHCSGYWNCRSVGRIELGVQWSLGPRDLPLLSRFAGRCGCDANDSACRRLGSHGGQVRLDDHDTNRGSRRRHRALRIFWGAARLWLGSRFGRCGDCSAGDLARRRQNSIGGGPAKQIGNGADRILVASPIAACLALVAHVAAGNRRNRRHRDDRRGSVRLPDFGR